MSIIDPGAVAFPEETPRVLNPSLRPGARRGRGNAVDARLSGEFIVAC